MRVIPGFSRWLWLGVALAAACSDDGLANQSTGLAETSSTSAAASSPESLTTAADPGTTHGLDEGSDGLPPEPSTSTASDGSGPASDSTGREVASGTGTDTGSGSGSDSTTGEPQSACADGCAVEFLCGSEWMSEEDCVTWCEANLIEAEAFSPFCRDAWEGVSACVATLTCEEFAVWADPMMFPYPCSDADVALAIECKGQ
jgi:hypothetical protein